MIQEQLNMTARGRFQLVVSGPRGVRVYEAPNLIVGAGLDRIMGGSAAWGFVQIGTGTAAPNISDTQLQNRINSTSTVQSAPANTYVAGPPDYIETNTTYRFALGALNSSVSGNFAEVGIGWASTGSLFSRALITDSGGVPTAISVLSDEQLDVIYRVRVYPIQTDVTGTVVLESVSYDYTIRPALVSTVNNTTGRWRPDLLFNSSFGMGATHAAGSAWWSAGLAYTGAIGTRTTIPGGTTIPITSSATIAPLGSYTNGSYARVRRSTWDLNDANGSVLSLLFSAGANDFCACLYQIGFSAALPKTSVKRLRLDFTHTIANRP
jgi:hypothetical protein